MSAADATIAEGAPLSREVAEAAADWMLRQQSGDADLAGLQAWLAANPEHQRAWRRIEKLRSDLRSMPPGVAKAALDRPHSPARRRTLQQLVLLLTAGGAGYLGVRELPWQSWSADLRTDTGERREVMLPDGSSLQLNTASAVDLYFDAQRRRVYLREGEIVIRTAPDATLARPFIVDTDQGGVRALGTRFTVRQKDAMTVVTVHEHAVEISIAGQSPQRLDAGHTVSFTASRIHDPTPADPNAYAWTRGLLYADRMTLGELTMELSRYRPGILRCDPAVAALEVSGAFPLEHTDDALALLEGTLPVQVQRRTSWWVTLVPALRK